MTIIKPPIFPRCGEYLLSPCPATRFSMVCCQCSYTTSQKSYNLHDSATYGKIINVCECQMDELYEALPMQCSFRECRHKICDKCVRTIETLGFKCWACEKVNFPTQTDSSFCRDEEPGRQWYIRRAVMRFGECENCEMRWDGRTTLQWAARMVLDANDVEDAGWLWVGERKGLGWWMREDREDYEAQYRNAEYLGGRPFKGVVLLRNGERQLKWWKYVNRTPVELDLPEQ